ncbi:hypothetical protein PQR64_23170 [Paraburkholderia phytofirmans]|uniref:hypothetical protein n=1 Tax=Paraburkholderia TaxID=1822464 RepID=UPI0038B890F8
MTRWLWGSAGLIFAAGVIATAQDMWDLSKSDWAAWVQAIGSVVAISIAIWIPANDRRIHRLRDTEAKLRGDVQTSALAFELAKDARFALQGAQTYFESYANDRIFRHTTDRLESAKEMLQASITPNMDPFIAGRLLRVNRQITLTIRDVRVRLDENGPTVDELTNTLLTQRMSRVDESIEQIRKHLDDATVNLQRHMFKMS